jgi:mannosyltransferase OCH1-like enzyme
MAIPKIIHYCWLSGDPIPDNFKKYMNSWVEKLQGYEFIWWTYIPPPSTAIPASIKYFDINMTTWTKQAFEVKLYAFAADYIRLYAVYNYGGIYLDMDMEVVKSFDPLLKAEIILGYEHGKTLEAGCFGAVKGHPFIKKCMEYFENNTFFNPDEIKNILAMPVSERLSYIKPLLLPESMKNILNQYFRNKYKIYPFKYFTANYGFYNGGIKQKKTTFTIHHFANTYLPEEAKEKFNPYKRIRFIFGENIIGKVICKLYFIRDKIIRQPGKNS